MRAPQYDGGPTKAAAEVNQSWFALAIGQISYAPRIVVQRRSGRCSAASHADCKPPPIPRSFFSFGPAMLLCMGWFFLVSPLDLAANSHGFTPVLAGGLCMDVVCSTLKSAPLTIKKSAERTIESLHRGWRL